MTKMIRAPILLFCLVLLFAGRAFALEEAGSYGKYRNNEMSRSSYEQYEVKPGGGQSVSMSPSIDNRSVSFSSADATARNRQRLADSHMNIPFYRNRTCESCHAGAVRNLHTTRARISCRQCHGGEPVASINYYFSRFNPIRKHAYVCDKCHRGADASFATYVIHEPNPASKATARSFPELYWAFWIMIGVAVMTFALFLPHTLLWGIRELFTGKPKEGGATCKSNVSL